MIKYFLIGLSFGCCFNSSAANLNDKCMRIAGATLDAMELRVELSVEPLLSVIISKSQLTQEEVFRLYKISNQISDSKKNAKKRRIAINKVLKAAGCKNIPRA